MLFCDHKGRRIDFLKCEFSNVDWKIDRSLKEEEEEEERINF